jgi:predicted nucleic acid-binding Zn ribbon protein
MPIYVYRCRQCGSVGTLSVYALIQAVERVRYE